MSTVKLTMCCIQEPPMGRMQKFFLMKGVTKRKPFLHSYLPTYGVAHDRVKIHYYYGQEETFLQNMAPMQENELESIRYAACRDYNGVVWAVSVPLRHHHCFAIMESYGIPEEERVYNEGFVTSTGRFVNRYQALNVAQLAGQLYLDHDGRKRTDPQYELFSEDLW